MIKAVKIGKDGKARVKHLIKALKHFDPEQEVKIHNGKHYVNLESVVPLLNYETRIGAETHPNICVVIRGTWEGV